MKSELFMLPSCRKEENGWGWWERRKYGERFGGIGQKLDAL
jgi:hypothetical protein